MRKGLTLIEIIVALAIFAILLSTVPSIFGKTMTNLGHNGNDINTINTAKTELNLAIVTPTYTGEYDNNITQSNVTVNVLGTDVAIRYIQSKVGELSQQESNYSFFMFAPTTVIDPVNPPTGGDLAISSEIFMDKDKDGVFNNDDTKVDLNSIGGNYSYSGTGNLVIGKDCWVNYPVNINVNDKVIIGNGSTLWSSGAVNINADSVILKDSTEIESQNSAIIINADKDVILGENCELDANASGGNIEINCENLTTGKGSIISSQTDNITIHSSGTVTLGEDTILDANANNGLIYIECIDLYMAKGSDISSQNSSITIDATGNVFLIDDNYLTTKSNGQIIINSNNLSLSNSNLSTQSGEITITCSGEVIIDNNTIIEASNSSFSVNNCSTFSMYNSNITAKKDFLNINSNNTISIVNGCSLTAQNIPLLLNAHSAYISGTNSNPTFFNAGGVGTVLNLSENGTIYFGEQNGGLNSFVTFSGGSKNGYAYNQNSTPFSTDYVLPAYDSSDPRYFK